MDRKLHEYFQAGVRLVWRIEPKTRTARAYTAVDAWREIAPQGSLSGGEVLPGFELPLAQLSPASKGRRSPKSIDRRLDFPTFPNQIHGEHKGE